jgi:DNA primase
MGKIVPSLDMKRLLERKVQLYKNQMTDSRGEKYLEARGITKEAQNYFHLGFVNQSEPSDEQYRGRVSIPYILPGGVVGIKYRAIDDSEPKYMSSSGFYAKRVYAPIFLTPKHRKVYVCEGEIDAITLAQFSIPAVALPGVDTWEPRMYRMFRNRFIVVLADGDDDGQGQKFASKILTAVDESATILMEGHDVNSYYTLNGKQSLLEKIGWTSAGLRASS